MFLFLLIGSLLAQGPIIIGSFDSQFDLTHEAIQGRAWVNTREIPDNNIDDDLNGYIDDINGWNYGDNNNKLFEADLDIYNDKDIQFFEYYLRQRAGIATDIELEWLKSNEDLKKRLGPYVSYLHGTCAGTGILKNTKNSQLISFRGTPREYLIYPAPEPSKIPEAGEAISEEDLQSFKKAYIDEIYIPYKNAVDYAAKNGARLMHFGYLWMLSENDTEDFQRLVFERKGKFLSKEQAKIIAREFYEDLMIEAKNLFTAHPQILFILPAGNTGSDIDSTISFPQGLESDNKLVVGAALYREGIAPYTTYGKKTVDVIMSTMNYYIGAPGNKYILANSTSVAAVTLTNLSALILEENPKLTTLELKRIILETVILKDSLKEKFKIPGIIYSDRALEAARISNYMSVDAAIQRSLEILRD